MPNIGNFTLLDARYYCIPINILKLSSGVQLCYLGTIESFWVLTLRFFRVGVPIVAQQVMNQINICEDVCSIPGLDQWVKDPALP